MKFLKTLSKLYRKMQGECKLGIARAESDSIPTPTDLAFRSGRDENQNPGYDGGAPELDFGSPRNSSVFYASADVKGFHYDANVVFNEVIQSSVHRLQFGQTLSISHPIVKGFAVSGEIRRFTQPFLRGNAVGNLWAISYTAKRNLVFDAGFESTSTHWEGFAGLTYLLPHRLW